MSWSETDALRDAEEQAHGHYVDLLCSECGEMWSVKVFEDEDLDQGESECPAEGCPGIGDEA